MNTLQHSTRWLWLALACGFITFTASVEAKKGGGGPPPPEPPPGPACQLVAVDGGGFSFIADQLFSPAWPYYPNMISDSGALVGMAWLGAVQVPAVWPPRITGGEVQYVTEDIKRFLNEDGMAEPGSCFAMNESGFAVGVFYAAPADPPNRACLWRPDGRAVGLLNNIEGFDSVAADINSDGYVLVGYGGWYQTNEGCGVIVPLDLDYDGQPDTWWTDVDEDGINDLLFPFAPEHNLVPLVINDANQVLLREYTDGSRNYLLTPDFSDADGDGNPWLSDANDDGFNDLLVLLDAPEPGAGVRAVGLNNLGQVAGQSGGHVVRWDFVDDEQIVTDLGQLQDKANMSPGGISDSGRIAGTCRIPLGRRSQTGPWWVVDNDSLYELLPLAVNGDGWSDFLERYAVNGYYSINRDNWILGQALFNSSLRRFVAVPVEQP